MIIENAPSHYPRVNPHPAPYAVESDRIHPPAPRCERDALACPAALQSRFNVDEEWWSWDVVGDSVEMINWGDGMDSVGEGYYPIGHKGTLSGGIKNFYTISHSHNHRIDIPDFFTGLPGEHPHSVDIPNTSSTTAFTSDVMPYIQFLVCEKD